MVAKERQAAKRVIRKLERVRRGFAMNYVRADADRGQQTETKEGSCVRVECMREMLQI